LLFFISRQRTQISRRRRKGLTKAYNIFDGLATGLYFAVSKAFELLCGLNLWLADSSVLDVLNIPDCAECFCAIHLPSGLPVVIALFSEFCFWRMFIRRSYRPLLAARNN